MATTTTMTTMTIPTEDSCLDPTPMGPRSLIQVVDSVPLEQVSTLLAATCSGGTQTKFFQNHEEIEYLLRPLLEMDNDHHKKNINDDDDDDDDDDENHETIEYLFRPLREMDNGRNKNRIYNDVDDDNDDVEYTWKQPLGVVATEDDDNDNLEAYYQKMKAMVVPPTLIPSRSSATAMVGPRSDWSFRSPAIDCAVCHVKTSTKDGLVVRRVSCDEQYCPSSIQTKSKSTRMPPPHKKKHQKSLKHAPPSAKRRSPIAPSSSSDADASYCKLRSYQALLWKEKFQELCDFKVLYGTCHVPHDWSINPSLAKWVKRQRYQHKLKKEGKHSTLTDTREAALDEMGFVWQSHLSAWEDKYQELLAYQAKHGHCLVPSQHSVLRVGTSSEHPQLAIWVQCQRRQYRLYCRGERSFMTAERVQKLDRVGFVWRPRQMGGTNTKQNKKQQQLQQQQEQPLYYQQRELPNPIMSSFTSD
jgi:hypothetical protein